MPRLLGSSKITARHQVTLPEDAMKILKIKEGEVIAFVEEDGKVIIKSEF